MIQRIQSVYLLLVALVSGLLVFGLSFFNLQGETIKLRYFLISDNIVYQSIGGLFIAIAVLALYNIFNYTNRNRQKLLNYFSIFLNVLLFGLLMYIYLNLSGEPIGLMKGIGVFTPWVSIVLLVLANRSIQKDENLVKSVDRIR